MANFSSLNAALPQNTNGRRDHNSFSEQQRPSFEYEPEARHQSRTSLIRPRNSDTGASFPQAMPAPYGNGTHRESNVGGGRPPFDLGRSPPNATNKSMWKDPQDMQERAKDISRYETRSLQVFPSRYLSSRKCLSVLTFSGSCHSDTALQVLPEGMKAVQAIRSNTGLADSEAGHLQIRSKVCSSPHLPGWDYSKQTWWWHEYG